MENKTSPTDDTLIHLRVSRERKGRWVKQSRDVGMKLTDWIIERVERHDKTDQRQPAEKNQ